MLQVNGDPHGLYGEGSSGGGAKEKRSRRNRPLQRKCSSLSKTLHPQLPRTRMRNVLCVGKHSTHPCQGKCGCSVSFASSGDMRHPLRVQNIISVTTVTMSRQMPFVMFLFVCTVYLLTPVKISQVSIQMDLFLPLDTSGSHSDVSKFSTVFWEYAMVSQRLSLTFVSAATDTWCFLAVFVCFLDHILSWWMKKTIEWKKCFIKWIDIANKQSKQFKFVLSGYF